LAPEPPVETLSIFLISLFAASGLTLTWAPPEGVAEFQVGFSLGILKFDTDSQIFPQETVPGPDLLRVQRSGTFSDRFENFKNPFHQIAQGFSGGVGFALEGCRSPGSFLFQHGPQAQPLEEFDGKNSNGPEAEIFAFTVLAARLLDGNETGLLQLTDGPFTAALTQAALPNDGLHVNINKPLGRGGSTHTQRSQIKAAEKDFQNDLAGLPALAPGLALGIGLERWAGCGMKEPLLGSFSGQSEDAGQAAQPLFNGHRRTQMRLFGVVAAAVARNGRGGVRPGHGLTTSSV
jgi:hypothetical protein